MIEVKKKFTPQEYYVEFKVEEEENLLRLDQFVMNFMASVSREHIKKKIKAGEVRIQGRPFPHKPSSKIYHREIISIQTFRKDSEDEYWDGKKLELEEPQIIFENDGFMAIYKPPYMTTHPTGKHLFNCATVFYENIYNHTIHSIHRLDRETSGIQLLGKNPRSTESVSKLFEHNQIRKCYFLIAHKNQELSFPFTASERMGTEDNFTPNLFVHCYPEESTQGKHASTEFHLLHQNRKYLFALAFPKTGRQHQIRAHASHHQFPLLGDKLYNGDPKVFMRFKDKEEKKEDIELMQISRHALHAIGLTFEYKNERFNLKAPIPEDLKDCIENLSEWTSYEDEIMSVLKSELFK